MNLRSQADRAIAILRCSYGVFGYKQPGPQGYTSADLEAQYASQRPQPGPPAPSQVVQKIGLRSSKQAQEAESTSHAGCSFEPHHDAQSPQSGHAPQKSGLRACWHSHEAWSASHAGWLLAAHHSMQVPQFGQVSQNSGLRA